MATPNVINTEIGYALRLLLNNVPSLRASADQRSDYQLLKAEVYELIAVASPNIAVLARDTADRAKGEAHLIHLHMDN